MSGARSGAGLIQAPAGAGLIEALYREHHGWLTGWLRRKSGCPQRAADLCHDTFLRLLAHARLPALDAPRAYLLVTANRLLLNHWRHARVENEALASLAALTEDDHAPDAAHEAAVRELLEQVVRMLLDELDPRTRRAFWLARADGLTYAEIGAELGVSTSRVKQLLAAALAHCHQRLQQARDALSG